MSQLAPITRAVSVIELLLIVALAVALVARALRFPYTVALVVVGLLFGVFRTFPQVHLDSNVVLFIFLPALLFEGAWSVDTQALRRNWLIIFLLAVPGLALSLGLTAAVVHWGAALPWLLALLVGAIVSPTDPITIIALLRQMRMPQRLLTILEGESLFNDGVGAAAFQVVLGVLLVSLGADGELGHLSPLADAAKVVWLLAGGPLIGFVIGYAVSHLVKNVDDPLLETTVTFCVAYGSYLLGTLSGTSGLLATVTAGLVLGSYGRRIGMSERTREQVDAVWQFIGYLANSLLFLLVGVSIGETPLLAALPAIVWGILAVLLSRIAMVYFFVPLHNLAARRLALRKRPLLAEDVAPRRVPRVWQPLIVLAGLRGALSLALVLSVPAVVPGFDSLRSVVYGVVLVTLVGQGIGLRILLPRWPKGAA